MGYHIFGSLFLPPLSRSPPRLICICTTALCSLRLCLQSLCGVACQILTLRYKTDYPPGRHAHHSAARRFQYSLVKLRRASVTTAAATADKHRYSNQTAAAAALPPFSLLAATIHAPQILLRSDISSSSSDVRGAGPSQASAVPSYLILVLLLILSAVEDDIIVQSVVRHNTFDLLLYSCRPR